MRSYKYKKVDAFTSNSSLGNPAAFLDLGSDLLSESEMLKIAKEHQGFVSEVIFCTSSENNNIKLTYYSSECEVSFCGHGTIATMYEMILNDPLLFERGEIAIDTNQKGKLTIYNRIESEDSIYITAPAAEWKTIPASVEEIASALQIGMAQISHSLPIDFIDAGLRTLIVPIGSFNDEISIFPNESILKAFCITKEIDIVLIFCLETEGKYNIAHTRVFAPKFGYLEDPATGSGNSAFGNYMIRNGIWQEGSVKVEQGSNRMIFNEIKLNRIGEKVLFGGKATKRIDGLYFLE